ncbi:MAG: hypothetical protein NTZ50_01945 [Chloroflexi bacterium]|nr:hypothetical protein [Chloroflexota bacterium]
MSARRVHWLPNFALIAICAAMIFPVFATFVISFKRQADVARKPPLLFPCDTPAADFDLLACRFDSEGYERLLANRPDATALFGRAFIDRMLGTFLPNTLLYAMSASLLVTLLAGMAGFAFARFEFRGRRALQMGILLLTGMPLLTNLIALYQLTVSARRVVAPLLGDGIAAFDQALLIVIYTGLFLPFSIWIVKGFYDAIPRDLRRPVQPHRHEPDQLPGARCGVRTDHAAGAAVVLRVPQHILPGNDGRGGEVKRTTTGDDGRQTIAKTRLIFSSIY